MSKDDSVIATQTANAISSASNSTVKLVYFYDVDEYSHENRICAASVASVVDYLCEVLARHGRNVEIVSASETLNTSGFYPQRTSRVSGTVTLTAGPTRGFKSPILRTFSKIRTRLWLVDYLKQNVSDGETVVFYGTPVLYEPLLLLHPHFRRHGIKVMYFAGEVFQYVQHLPWIKRRMEWRILENEDFYLCATPLLESRINIHGRPSAILSGVYKTEPDYGEGFRDGKVHVVYSGVIRPDKGSSTAVKIARYLGSDYVLHVLGWGADDDVRSLIELITEVNSEGAGCKVIFEGLKRGREYKAFLQRCQIGLCPQNLAAAYNSTSFPSKILAYLSNGLRVVSIDIPAIRSSEIGELLWYSASDTAEDIAATVQDIDMDEFYDSRTVIDRLDTMFTKRIGEML